MKDLDMALYLAREAGVRTTAEEQRMIVRSPPFSNRERPFLLENFFEVPDYDDERDLGDDFESEFGNAVQAEGREEVDPRIHSAIQRYFRPDLPAKFLHNGEEWLCRAEGRGTRKRATAHAVIVRGSGVFKINGEADMYHWWPLVYNRFDVCQPFKYTRTAGVYDVFVHTRGGGHGGQAGATRLAIARALFEANPACHDDLQKGHCLLEDTRQKMSKRAGKAGARKSFAWNKR